MRIHSIPYPLVAADAAAIKATKDTSHPSSRSQRFSTAHHSHSEILPIVPETATFVHKTPPWKPYAYTLWHPLVATSQSLKSYHTIHLPSFLYEDLLRCHSSWIATGRITPSLLTDVIDTLKNIPSGKHLSSLLNGTKKWFIRLDQMSPKDSPEGGKLPSSTIEEILTKICTSMCAYGCLQREYEDARKEGRDVSITLVLNPWDEGMDPAREFRVFVPPPAARGLESKDFRVSAISQYRWPMVFEAPWGFSLKQSVDFVAAGADTVLVDIVAYAEKELSRVIMGLLLEYGFSYDVALKEDGGVQLVEINPFGALSGCGACLFNWVIDGRVLYGLEEPLFAVTLEATVDS
jgi:hypothetical protein